jgi:GntR family transcriptional regulator of vanillate catabolism
MTSPALSAGGQPVRRSRGTARSMDVADLLREDILTGRICAGQRINEVHLSARLEMSRTPVRAALHALAAEGLLDYECNRGFTVRDYSPGSVAQAYEIRAALEGVASRFAAEHGLTADQRLRFDAALRAGDAVIAAFTGSAEQIAAYRAANVQFHDAVLDAADNPILRKTIEMTLALPGATFRNIVSFAEREVRQRHDDHHRIYAAICAGDGWRAEFLMREHVSNVKAAQIQRFGPGEAAAAILRHAQVP